MSRGNKNSGLNVAARQAQERKLMEENPDVATWTQQRIADAIGASNRDAVGRDLREIAKPMVIENTEAREAAKLQQLRTFELIERSLVDGKVPPDIAREWLHVRAEISKLVGLNAETRSTRLNLNVDATADPTTMGFYDRFIRGSRGRTPDQMEEVFRFMDSLPNIYVDVTPPQIALPPASEPENG
jgi:hypothetical protein